MSRFLDRAAKILRYASQAVGIAEDVVSIPKVLKDDENGTRLRLDVKQLVLAGEQQLLDMHDIEQFDEEEEALFDEGVLKISEAALTYAQRKLTEKKVASGDVDENDIEKLGEDEATA